MRLIGATSILVLICAMPALAAELPSRKQGLWQVKTSIGGSKVPAPVIKQHDRLDLRARRKACDRTRGYHRQL